jgi:hypothetical protein
MALPLSIMPSENTAEPLFYRRASGIIASLRDTGPGRLFLGKGTEKSREKRKWGSDSDPSKSLRPCLRASCESRLGRGSGTAVRIFAVSIMSKDPDFFRRRGVL